MKFYRYALLTAWLFGSTVAADDLDDAFERLVEGRSYLNGYPDSKETGRYALVVKEAPRVRIK